VAVVVAFAVALLVGFFNGYLVIWTGLPSFIVTLAMLFALRGLTIGFSRLLTGRTQIGLSDAISGSPLKPLFAGTVGSFSVSIIWWLGLAVLATWVLQRTVFGNWIFAAGGDPNAARNVGVPVNRVKIILFMCTALSAALLATIQVLDAGSADVLRGELLELQAIAASVIGGVLLTGGYGSVVGALFGALIFGMVQQGIFFIGVSTDWFLVFVGVMLLIAVVFNNIIRKRASEAR
jgi:simple sugar transport system permease protein